MKRESGSYSSAFEVVRNGINLDISKFQEQQAETVKKIREKIKLLADAVKDKVPPLMIIKADKLEPNNRGLITLYEYFPSENMIYGCVRHSRVLEYLDLHMNVAEERNAAGFYGQSIQWRREQGEGDPMWIEFAPEIITKLENSAQNKDKGQIPTFSLEYAGKTLIFPIIPLPEDLVSRYGISKYSQETDLMRKRGGEFGNIYSAKSTSSSAIAR